MRVLSPLLRENANFRRYYVGQAVSLLGDQVALIALPLTAVLALHASAGQMGVLTTVALVPNLLFSLHLGVWLDRIGRRRQAMLVADAARGLTTATVPIAYALGHLTWTQLYITAFLLGSFSVVFYVAYGGLFQAIVPREQYVEAQALLNGTRGGSFLVGTSIGGTLVQLLRGPYALAVDAVSFLWSALFLGRIDAEEPPGAPREAGGVMTGLRWIRNNAVMRAELLGVATINLFNFMYFALLMLYLTRALGLRPATIGLILGIAAVGTLGTSAVTARLARRFGVGPVFLVGCFLFPAPLIIVPAAGGPHWFVIGLLFTAELISGVGLMMLDILAGAISAAIVPPAMRSRASGAFMVVNYGVRPIGTALAGVLGSTIGVRPTLWIATVGALAGMAFLLPSPLRTMREVPATAEL
ncbi:MAG TPA: MFS transporter [Gaiellaceae bacterium]